MSLILVLISSCFIGFAIAGDWYYVRYPKHAFWPFTFLKYCHLWWSSRGWNGAVFQNF